MTTPEEFFADSPDGRAALRWVEQVLREAGVPFTVRVSKSQVAFRGRRGFAYLWRPTQYLGPRARDVVLAIASSREIRSDRFKEVVHPAASTWMHHLEIRSPADLDDEVATWVRQAAEEAGPAG